MVLVIRGGVKMKSSLQKAIVSAVFLLTAGSVRAGEITFSNMFVGGSLSTGATLDTTTHGIELTLPHASVSDGANSVPFGTITFGFVAESETPMIGDHLLLDMLSLAGSGTIVFHETFIDIQDPLNPKELASLSVVLNGSVVTAYNADLTFSHSSTRIFVLKTIALLAFDFDPSVADFASLASVQQTFQLIPEPATVVFLLSGTALFVGTYLRRTRKTASRI